MSRKQRGARRAGAIVLAACALAATPARAQLTIRLTGIPANTPAGAAIHVAGSFNVWNPGDSSYRLRTAGGGEHVITLPDFVRGDIEFKFTLGSWESVETTASGGDVPNRAMLVPASGPATAIVSVEGWRSTTNKVATPPRPTASASVSVLSDSFRMPQLDRTRRVWLYLPPDYATSNKRYPVLYMHDGQNVFDAATSFAGEWGVDESLDSLHARGDWGVIVVAVDHGGTRRLDEYNPWANRNPRFGGGEGDEYVDFLVHTLKPYIDRQYRTRPDRPNTGIMGSSAGALISLYAALKYPDTFGRVGLFSTAAWLAAPQIFAYARHAKTRQPFPRFLFLSGALETKDGEPAREQRQMTDTLAAAGLPVAAMRSLSIDDGKHSEWFWKREFPAAYLWLFEPVPSRSPAVRPR